MNNFGGNWTKNKINILVEYAKAYLSIMNKYAEIYDWEIFYFDGFAGSGLISSTNEQSETDNLNLFNDSKESREDIVGAALEILQIDEPRAFDFYYFVEKSKSKLEKLEQDINSMGISNKTIHYVDSDCNVKLKDLSAFLLKRENRRKKFLAFIDPCGMQLEWSALESFKNVVAADMWILIPTGLGVNRLLVRDGNISDEWSARLSKFLGMDISEIKDFFYVTSSQGSLFEQKSMTFKVENAIQRSAELYQARLKTVFNHVSNTFALTTPKNNTLFHFVMVSNNPKAVKIANDIIRIYQKKR